MFYKESVSIPNEDEIGILDIDEDDGIDSDIIPSVISKKGETKRVPSDPKRIKSKPE